MHFQVVGRDRENGAQKTWVIDAPSEGEAVEKANRAGFDVIQITPKAAVAPTLGGGRYGTDRSSMNWLEQQFADSSEVLLLFAGVCMIGLVWILALIVLLTTRHPEAKRKAKFVVIAGAIAYGSCFGLGLLMALVQILTGTH